MKLKVKVPATSANLGAGFDTLGVALTLYNEFIIEENDSVEINTVPYTPELEDPEKNLFIKVLKRSCEYLGNEFHGVKVTQKINIPVARGLGSSATAIVAGILSSYFVNKKDLSDEEFFKIAYEFEPHPDNLLPAWKGGLITACIDNEKTFYNKIGFPQEIKAVVVIPELELSTEEARKVLPDKIPLRDGIYNVQRVSLFISALCNKRFDLLKIAMDDRFHQPYRKKLIPGFEQVINAAKENGAIGASLSGAGSTIIAFAVDNFNIIGQAMVDVFEKQGIKSTYKVLDVDNSGAKVQVIE